MHDDQVVAVDVDVCRTRARVAHGVVRGHEVEE
jgi:hypothetical protein